MKIVITGSLGNISKPLTQELVRKGHLVTVISSNTERQKDIEAIGAKPAIGSLENPEFLAATFAGADAIYCMVPPNNYFDHNLNLLEYYRRLGKNYALTIKQAGVKHVVNLSSIGAHMEKGNGILLGAHDVESILNELPLTISITHIRPTSFYYNLYAYANTIKELGYIAANYGDEDIIPWVSPQDIANAVTEELLGVPSGRKARYVCSEELTCNQTAQILGEAVGKPKLKWLTITNEQMENGLVAAGMNPRIASGLVEMYAGLHSGLLLEDYFQNQPTFGNVKMTDFVKEFAAVYHQS
ncbi:NAD(P)H-binding protein [Mariniflexile litorale]|uniref:NAD(P)H-binding protein n=1 Tax=Mariniflexile litorale TaxID=3045158 RepID=A0AAU7EH62_9FLAO|nr:NAD(P)H-binding protein [Mariniflexile sp. KMM 9835]MDQ8212046.1 NAD(P)H-binding protein [Mariniflexile sp. KMM 9835]